MGNVNSTERNESNESNESNELMDNETIYITLIGSEQQRELELDIAAEEIQEVAIAYLNAKQDKKREFHLLKQEIHDILFEEKESIPNGIYIKLMNVIKN